MRAVVIVGPTWSDVIIGTTWGFIRVGLEQLSFKLSYPPLSVAQSRGIISGTLAWTLVELTSVCSIMELTLVARLLAVTSDLSSATKVASQWNGSTTSLDRPVGRRRAAVLVLYRDCKDGACPVASVRGQEGTSGAMLRDGQTENGTQRSGTFAEQPSNNFRLGCFVVTLRQERNPRSFLSSALSHRLTEQHDKRSNLLSCSVICPLSRSSDNFKTKFLHFFQQFWTPVFRSAAQSDVSLAATWNNKIAASSAAGRWPPAKQCHGTSRILLKVHFTEDFS